MPAPQKFRSAFNGFNRDDVVHYLEYLNAKHTGEVNQLTSELEFLRTKLESRIHTPDQAEQIAALTEERDALLAQVAELTQRCAALEAQPPVVVPAPAPVEVQSAFSAAEELEAYRRAERTERLARERAELVYHQINGVLAEVTAKVDGTASEISIMTDQVMAQLGQLQLAVSGSKQALKDAAATMYAIRPDNN